MDNSVVTFISNYFIAPEKRNKPIKRLQNGSGIILSWGELDSYANLSYYTNWLTSMIRYSRKLNIDLINLIKLTKEGYIKKLGWEGEEEFINIFLDSIERNDIDGGKIGENTLSHNSLEKDKKYDK